MTEYTHTPEEESALAEGYAEAMAEVMEAREREGGSEYWSTEGDYA